MTTHSMKGRGLADNLWAELALRCDSNHPYPCIAIRLVTAV